MILEMRTYKTKAGMRSRFIETFRTKSIPAQAEIGMKIPGPFLSVEDPDTFFFMRGFPDLAFARTDEGKVLRRGAFGARAGEPPDANVGQV
jgi:hypothetical protein